MNISSIFRQPSLLECDFKIKLLSRFIEIHVQILQKIKIAAPNRSRIGKKRQFRLRKSFKIIMQTRVFSIDILLFRIFYCSNKIWTKRGIKVHILLRFMHNKVRKMSKFNKYWIRQMQYNQVRRKLRKSLRWIWKKIRLIWRK